MAEEIERVIESDEIRIKAAQLGEKLKSEDGIAAAVSAIESVKL